MDAPSTLRWLIFLFFLLGAAAIQTVRRWKGWCQRWDMHEISVPAKWKWLLSTHPRVRVFQMEPTMLQQLQSAVYELRWKGTSLRVGDFFRWSSETGQPLFLYGGAVRDFLLMKPIKDIDLFAGSDAVSIASLQTFCNKHAEVQCIPNPRWPKVLKIKSFKPEDERGTFSTMDLLTDPLLRYGDESYDFTFNTIVFSYQDSLLFDLTGHGISDTCGHILRITVPPPYWNRWYTGEPKHHHRILRYFKFLLKGFTPASPAMERFVVDKLVQDWPAISSYAYVFFDTKHPVALFELLLSRVQKYHPEAWGNIQADIQRILAHPPKPLFAPTSSTDDGS